MRERRRGKEGKTTAETISGRVARSPVSNLLFLLLFLWVVGEKRFKGSIRHDVMPFLWKTRTGVTLLWELPEF